MIACAGNLSVAMLVALQKQCDVITPTSGNIAIIMAGIFFYFIKDFFRYYREQLLEYCQ